MGCISSKRIFTVREDIEGQGALAYDVFVELGLEDDDINVLYTAFWDIDADGSGSIMPIEFFAYFEMEYTSFEGCIFSIFDEDHSGVVNFMEFVCSVWNILTLSRDAMGQLAFLIADPTGMKTISYSDVAHIIEIMHKKKVDADPALQSLMTNARRNLIRDVTIAAFTDFCMKHPSLTVPMHMLQMHLRRQIIGERFWVKMTKLREEDVEQGTVGYMAALQQRVMRENREFRRQRQLEELELKRRERRGLGPGGDHRKLMEKQQSVLIRHFALRKSKSSKSKRNFYVRQGNDDKEAEQLLRKEMRKKKKAAVEKLQIEEGQDNNQQVIDVTKSTEQANDQSHLTTPAVEKSMEDVSSFSCCVPIFFLSNKIEDIDQSSEKQGNEEVIVIPEEKLKRQKPKFQHQRRRRSTFKPKLTREEHSNNAKSGTSNVSETPTAGKVEANDGNEEVPSYSNDEEASAAVHKKNRHNKSAKHENNPMEVKDSSHSKKSKKENEETDHDEKEKKHQSSKTSQKTRPKEEKNAYEERGNSKISEGVDSKGADHPSIKASSAIETNTLNQNSESTNPNLVPHPYLPPIRRGVHHEKSEKYDIFSDEPDVLLNKHAHGRSKKGNHGSRKHRHGDDSESSSSGDEKANSSSKIDGSSRKKKRSGEGKSDRHKSKNQAHKGSSNNRKQDQQNRYRHQNK